MENNVVECAILTGTIIEYIVHITKMNTITDKLNNHSSLKEDNFQYPFILA
jgi:hypothetical protein